MRAVYKYRIFVQARTDMTADEIAQYEASKGNAQSPTTWPYRDTGEIIHARRRKTACAFYRALRRIKPIIKIRAERINDPKPLQRNDDIALRAWIGFECARGSVNGVEDEVKHFLLENGRTACGIWFTSYGAVGGKPECDKCLAAAVEKHPEMKQYL